MPSTPSRCWPPTCRWTSPRPRCCAWRTGVTAAPGTPIPTRINLPKGKWVLIGYGRFGQTISATLDEAGVPWKAIDPDRDLAGEARCWSEKGKGSSPKPIVVAV